MKNTAIVLLSAGLDSTTSLALAREAGVDITHAIAFDYGQKAARSEWAQAQKIAAHYDLYLQKVDLPWLGVLNTSALSENNPEALPQIDIESLDNVMGVTLASAARVWVPNRNGLFMNIAAVWADRFELQEIITGFNAEEAMTFPDNTPQFATAITQSLAYSTQVQPTVKSYVQHLNKIEVVQEALRLQVPLELLWSCYASGDHHCGRCESCSRLKRALQVAQQQSLMKTLFGESFAE